MLVKDPRGWFVRKAPRPTADKKLYWRWWMRQEFALAARWASNAEPIAYQTAVEMSKGTEFIPRDILMMASMGTYYEVELPDGTLLEPGRMATSNVQYILGLLDPTQGAIITYSNGIWSALPKGKNQDVLTMNGNVPTWLPNSGGAGGGGAVDLLAVGEVESGEIVIDGLPDDYHSWEIVFSDIVGSIDGFDLRVTLRHLNANISATYKYWLDNWSSSGSSQVSNSTSGANIPLTTNSGSFQTGNGTGKSASGRIRLYNPASALFKKCNFQVEHDYTTSNHGTVFGGATLETLETVDGIRLYLISGSITAGSVRIYGYR